MPTIDQQKATKAALRLCAPSDAPRENLEDDTIRIEEALSARQDDHVLGPVAYADFNENFIEVQFEVLHTDGAGLRDKITTMWAAIEEVVNVADEPTQTKTAPIDDDAALCTA